MKFYDVFFPCPPVSLLFCFCFFFSLSCFYDRLGSDRSRRSFISTVISIFRPSKLWATQKQTLLKWCRNLASKRFISSLIYYLSFFLPLCVFIDLLVLSMYIYIYIYIPWYLCCRLNKARTVAQNARLRTKCWTILYWTVCIFVSVKHVPCHRNIQEKDAKLVRNVVNQLQV